MKNSTTKSVWIRLLPVVGLLALGVLTTYLVFKIFPFSSGHGFEDLGSLMLTLMALGFSMLIYIIGTVANKYSTRRVFVFCYLLFCLLFAMVRLTGMN